MKKFITLLTFVIFLCSCATKKQPDGYDSAMRYLKVGNYSRAGELFEKIEDSQPFTEDATNGLIMASYSYYKGKDYEDSIRVIDYFIQSNPINENIPYMYYLKSLNYFDRIKSVAKARDLTESADASLRDVINKFPETEYARDALSRLKKTETYLSGNEMNIGNYYLKRKNYIGAMNHYIKILEEYPRSNFVPEALYRLIEINTILGLKLEAVQYYKVLSENFKENHWTQHATNLIKKYE